MGCLNALIRHLSQRLVVILCLVFLCLRVIYVLCGLKHSCFVTCLLTTKTVVFRNFQYEYTVVAFKSLNVA